MIDYSTVYLISQEISSPSSYSSVSADHDYTVGKFDTGDVALKNKKKKRSYIVEDAPPEGYGFENGISMLVLASIT